MYKAYTSETLTLALRIEVRQVEDDVRNEAPLHETKETTIRNLADVIRDRQVHLPSRKEACPPREPKLAKRDEAPKHHLRSVSSGRLLTDKQSTYLSGNPDVWADALRDELRR